MWHWLNGADAHPGWPITTERLSSRIGAVGLREIRARDAFSWSTLRSSGRTHLQPWEPTIEGADWLTRHHATAWPAVCAQQRSAAKAGVTIPAVIELDGKYAGQLTIGGIVRGAVNSGWLGYWVGEAYTGGGVATAAVALAVDHAFGPAKMHRVEATVRPENLASRRVLEIVGFREEGLLKRYLNVDGLWRDHILVAQTVDDYQRSAAERLILAGRAQWAN